jgi:hypothetical protein
MDPLSTPLFLTLLFGTYISMALYLISLNKKKK